MREERKLQWRKPARRKSQQGLTLIEVTIATALTLLLFFGALDLYLASARLSLNTASACYAITDGANAVQHTIRDTEEARWLALPGENGWTSPGGAPAGAFQTTDGGTTIATGVQLVSPATAVVSVQSRSGSVLSVAPSLYDRTQDAAPASPLWIYRANRDGTPNAAAGACLWIYGTERGQLVSKALISSLSPTLANAVKFARPQTTASARLPYQLQISLVSTYYSPLQQAQTSEINATAQETYVVGKCVLLRDHEMNFDHEPNSTASYGAANAPVWRSD